jgi:ABC-type amino acid transport substrate-binding protein
MKRIPGQLRSERALDARTDARPTSAMSACSSLWQFVVLLAVLLMVSCTNGEASEVGSSPIPRPTPPPPTSTPLPADATTSARVRAREVLLVGVRYDLYPFGYIDQGGEAAGLGVDIGREFARRWLGDAEAVQFSQVRSDTAVEHLQAGNVDVVITALAHMQNLEAGADFTLPYFMDGQALLVRAADAPAICCPASLDGRMVGIVSWGEAQAALEATVPFTLSLQPYDRFDAAVDALGRGEVHAVADLRRRLFWGRRMLPETNIVGQYTTVPVAIAFPYGDPFFADLVNLTLQEMVVDGTYADLYERWFGPELPPSVERWPGDEVPSLADAPVVADVPDTIAAIQSRGRLLVAMVSDRDPFAYIDGTGAPVGYEVGLVRQMAKRWLGDSGAVDFIPASVEEGQAMVRAGEVDLFVGGLAHTRAAELELDFGLTTYVAGESLLVQAGTSISDVVSLRGHRVAVVGESGSREVVLAAAQEAGVSLTVLPQPTLEAAISLLAEGQVAAVAGERSDLLGPAYATPGLGVLPLRLTRVPLAVALAPGDSAFRDLVNLTLQAMRTEGQLDALYTAWFDDAPPAMEIWPGVPYRPLRLEVPVSQEDAGG